MEQEKNNYSTAESDHNNQPEKPNDDSAGAAAAAGGAARSYDCAFCKRGFTNAQALGGHMNIHRKDKAKAKTKHKNHEDPLTQSFNSNSSFFPQITTAGYGGHANYQVYMPPPNPGLQTGNYEYCFFPVWRPDNLEDRIDGDLSLRMGRVEDEEEVDLELRLG